MADKNRKWPILSETVRPEWPIKVGKPGPNGRSFLRYSGPRLVLLHVLDLPDLTTNSSRDQEFVTDIFIGHRNISKPIK